MTVKRNPEARSMYRIIGFDEPSPTGEFAYHFASLGDLYRFCQRNDLSLATFFIQGVKNVQVKDRLATMLWEPRKKVENPFAFLQRLRDAEKAKK